MDSTALIINNLTKTYSNGHKALHGINLEIEHGDFFALLGPNGAGKSTTIGIITSLIKKTSGDINIYGIDIDKNFKNGLGVAILSTSKGVMSDADAIKNNLGGEIICRVF